MEDENPNYCKIGGVAMEDKACRGKIKRVNSRANHYYNMRNIIYSNDNIIIYIITIIYIIIISCANMFC